MFVVVGVGGGAGKTTKRVTACVTFVVCAGMVGISAQQLQASLFTDSSSNNDDLTFVAARISGSSSATTLSDDTMTSLAATITATSPATNAPADEASLLAEFDVVRQRVDLAVASRIVAVHVASGAAPEEALFVVIAYPEAVDDVRAEFERVGAMIAPRLEVRAPMFDTATLKEIQRLAHAAGVTTMTVSAAGDVVEIIAPNSVLTALRRTLDERHLSGMVRLRESPREPTEATAANR